VLLCHGSPRDTTEYLFENRSDVYLRQFTAGERADTHADVIVSGRLLARLAVDEAGDRGVWPVRRVV
jgi:hypothetical protein